MHRVLVFNLTVDSPCWVARVALLFVRHPRKVMGISFTLSIICYIAAAVSITAAVGAGR